MDADNLDGEKLAANEIQVIGELEHVTDAPKCMDAQTADVYIGDHKGRMQPGPADHEWRQG